MTFKNKSLWIKLLTLVLILVVLLSPQVVKEGFIISFLRGYQKHISPAGAPKCCFYPSCSQYTIDAIKKHGPLKGWCKSCDRFTRCSGEKWLYPEIVVDGEARQYDPP